MFSDVVLIYQSSHAADREAAEQLAAEMSSCCEGIIKARGSQGPGHIEGIAYHAARHYQRPLIIAVGSDHVYHESINGIMRAAADGYGQVVCGFFDPRRDKKQVAKLLAAAANGDTKRIDLLTLKASTETGSVSRVAHSAIAMGLTVSCSRQLAELTGTASQGFFRLAGQAFRGKPVEVITQQGHHRRFDGLVFSNHRVVSDVLRVSTNARPDDGFFEVIAVPTRGRLNLLAWLVRASSFGFGCQPQVKSYYISLSNDTAIQLDNEVLQLSAGDKVHIGIRPEAVEVLV